MDKVDFKRSLPSFRAKQGRFDVIEVPEMQYLVIDGHGDPNTSPDFTAAVTSLYPLAYGLKFFSKLELGRDYVVPPLEGLWWADDMATFTSARDKSAWYFTLMLLVPDWLDLSCFTLVSRSWPEILDLFDQLRGRWRKFGWEYEFVSDRKSVV